MTSTTKGVQVGQQAPDFILPSQSGGRVSLADYRGRQNVVLYFYPKDNSPVCTAEACAFRDSYEVFVEAGAQVVGISSDSIDSHTKFADKHELPFTLLSDSGGSVRRSYGVPKNFGLVPGRVTYVIDRHGTVRHIFNAAMHVDQHVSEALTVVQRLQADRAAT